MADVNNIPRLVILVGPTGVGKTEAAVAMAQDERGEIISADSMQVYRHMDIGTAKPNPEQQTAVPHHCIDLVEPDEAFNASLFIDEADKAIDRLHLRKVPVFVVGGSGLYIKALLGGLFDGPRADEALRAFYKSKAASYGKAYLHGQLKKMDPKAASAIAPHDASRVIRALEVFELTGVSIIDQQQRHRFNRRKYACLKMGLTMDRDMLSERIDRRTDQMIESGFVGEVQALLDQGYLPELKSMQSLGYKQIVGYLQGLYGLDEAVRLIKQDTKRYAKRQMTWFKRDPEVVWVLKENGDDLKRKIGEFLYP
jgi:tRNA dimethylallyltransferase